MYPKIVITIFFGVLVLMMTFVVPKFAEFYGGFGAELPLPTLILMGISNAFVNYWYLMILGFAGIVYAFKKYAATENGRMKIDRLRFKMPVFGNLNLLPQ